MTSFLHLRLLANRKDFQTPELLLCATRWNSQALRSSPEEEEVRRLLGLKKRGTDAYVLTVLLCLKAVEAVLEQFNLPRLDAYPTTFRLPAVAEVTGAKFEADGSGAPYVVGPAGVFPQPDEVILQRVNNFEARVSVDGHPEEIVRAALTNGVLSVAWPAWLNIRGVLLPSADWEGGEAITIRLPVTKAPFVLMDALLSQASATRSVLQEADLTDLHFGAASPAHRVGYVAAALAATAYNRNRAALA